MKDTAVWGTVEVPVHSLGPRIERNRQEYLKAFESVLNSQQVILGGQVTQFEEEFAAFLGVTNVVSVGSGSDALVIAMRCLGLGHGSTVLLAPNAGGYAANAAQQIGASVVYCDIDPVTHLISGETLSAAIGPDIDAVVVTHLYGNVANVPELRELCDPLGTPIIEDCAQAAGGHLDGSRVGTLGALATFSFYPTKNLGALGDGGALATNDPSLATKARSLRQYGWDDKYHTTIPFGINSRLDELQAAFLRVALPHLDTSNDARRGIVTQYTESVSESILEIATQSRPGDSCHLAVLVTPSAEDKRRLKSLLAANGVATSVHYPKLDLLQKALTPPSRPTRLDNALQLGERILTVPLYEGMRSVDIQRVSGSLNRFQLHD